MKEHERLAYELILGRELPAKYEPRMTTGLWVLVAVYVAFPLGVLVGWAL